LIIRARAPLRLGLAGGGTDVSPYCDEYGGLVLNTTIDRYAYASIFINDNFNKIEFFSTDKNSKNSYSLSQKIELSGPTLLLKATYLHMIKNFNNGKKIPLMLSTFCDSPPGSGLGTSSTLVVAMVEAFSCLLNLKLDSYKIAEIAYKIERIECNLMGGKQDQYSAAFGGFNFIEFNQSNVVVKTLNLESSVIKELEASLLLFFTGVSRDSDKIILSQSNNMAKKDKKAMDALHKIKNEATNMKNKILDGDFYGIVESMKTGWINKKKSADIISNPLIEKMYNSAINAGALAGKVSGAGGGGFMIFYVPLDKRKSVIESLQQFNGEVSNTHFTNIGVKSWKLI